MYLENSSKKGVFVVIRSTVCFSEQNRSESVRLDPGLTDFYLPKFTSLSVSLSGRDNT